MKCGFEIGATAATRRDLTERGIPSPDSWTYSPYSLVRRGGDGRARGFGYPTATWTWETLSQPEVNKLLGFFGAATDASVVIYITTAIDTGRGEQTFQNFTAIMGRPVDGAGKAMISETEKPTFNNVTVTFTHLE
jgi:hypothetical protein